MALELHDAGVFLIKAHHKSATKDGTRYAFGKTVQVADKPARIIGKVFKLVPVGELELSAA